MAAAAVAVAAPPVAAPLAAVADPASERAGRPRPNASVGRALRLRRLALHRSQRDVGLVAGLSQATVWRVENDAGTSVDQVARCWRAVMLLEAQAGAAPGADAFAAPGAADAPALTHRARTGGRGYDWAAVQRAARKLAQREARPAPPSTPPAEESVGASIGAPGVDGVDR